MKKSKYALEDKKKDQKSAATNFSSSSALAPPAFNLSNNQNQLSSTSSQSGSTKNKSKAQVNSLPSKTGSKAPQQAGMREKPKKDTSQSNQNEQDSNQFLSSVSSDHFLTAFENARDIFNMGASLQGIKIHGGIASSGPGCLNGPSLKNMIKNDPELLMRYHNNEVDEKIIHIASSVISDHFNMWRDSFMIPNLMWYPQFNFVPSPFAPPMPNIPCLVSSCMPGGLGMMKHSTLKNMMTNYLSGDERNDHNLQLLESIADKVSFQFYLWTESTLLQGILGQGPVPGFRPPFSFGGPVVNGSTHPCHPFL